MLEQEIVIVSTKVSSRLRSLGNNDQRDFLNRGVKNTDKLETTFAVATHKWDVRFAIHL